MKACRSAAVIIMVLVGSASAADWPAFRGSNCGVSADKDLPASPSNDNILWKVKLPGPGTSSPITHGDKIFLTCYAGYGTTITKGLKGGFGKEGYGKGADSGGDQKKLRLLVMCLDSKGTTVWQKEIAPKLPEAPFSGFLREHGYASSTPAADGERIYVFFGKTGVLAFDVEGKQLWQADVGSGTNKWGSAASPVVTKDLVIVNAAVESRSIVGLDKRTGKEVWRIKGLRTSWSSPILAETRDGKQELVLNVPGKIAGYDPATGKELWHCEGIGSTGEEEGGFGFGGGSSASSTPVARDGIVYAMGGGGRRGKATSLAVKLGGSGDVTKTHVLWRQDKGSGNCSPVLSGDYFCWVSGIASGLNAADGKAAYQERLYDSRQEYVSAVVADNKIYALTRVSGMFVLAGGGKFEKLGHLDFQDDSVFNASPAISNGRIYVRSNRYLYCLGKK